MISDLYGLIGILLILVAWLPETIKNLRAARVTTRFEFLLLYTSGSLLLTIHAYILGDIIFIVLNALATVLSGINIALKLLQSKNRKSM